MRLCAVLLAWILAGCASLSIEIEQVESTWSGHAFGRHYYRGSCVRHITSSSGSRTVVGAWEWPDSIHVVDWLCQGGSFGQHDLRSTLAHELAHMIECGSNETCAVRTTEEWLAAGVTLAELGWPD